MVVIGGRIVRVWSSLRDCGSVSETSERDDEVWSRGDDPVGSPLDLKRSQSHREMYQSQHRRYVLFTPGLSFDTRACTSIRHAAAHLAPPPPACVVDGDIEGPHASATASYVVNTTSGFVSHDPCQAPIAIAHPASQPDPPTHNRTERPASHD